MTLIDMDSLTKVFKKDLTKKKVCALNSLTLQVQEGEIFGFLGPNGAGKSTTIKLLLHLIRPTSGRLSIDGKAASDKNVRRMIGYLPENPYFYDHLSAKELLWFGGKSCDLNDETILQRSAVLFKMFDLTDAMNRPLRSYSKGMIQRAGLALALIHDPKLLILDEPMSGLDPMGRKKVFDLILQLKEEGKTVFFSSHILHDIERLCDRAAILINGSLVRSIHVRKDLPAGKTLEEVFFEEVNKSGGLRE
ncbi:MAG TPA: ABC transporter ATP-binding protein [Nitrospirota bacterium]|nr:ABC transporter ATP-binding protein [Nitrospirota bacterium]